MISGVVSATKKPEAIPLLRLEYGGEKVQIMLS